MSGLTANLNIAESVTAAFTSQPSPRAIYCVIEGETITLRADKSAIEKGTSSTPDDFANVAKSLQPNDPIFVIFNLKEKAPGKSDDSKWVLIVFVPDLSKVRDKMLYSSSRETLKKGLGISLFASSDFYANELGDITWASYESSIDRTVVLTVRLNSLSLSFISFSLSLSQ
jgi:twinfilin-like protein